MDELNKKVDRLDAVIFGDNSPGLKDTVVRLDVSIDKFDLTLKKLANAVDRLVSFMYKTQGMEKAKTKSTNTIRWLVGINITLLVTLVSIIITAFK